MRKRRRLLTPMKKKTSTTKPVYSSIKEEIIETPTTPRGRLKGALKEALDPTADESDLPMDYVRKERFARRRYQSDSSPQSSSDEEMSSQQSTTRQPYVLKLFDRSVDLSQFKDDSPLYPICRAWMLNQPKICYKKYGKKKYKPPEPNEDSVELPGAEGPPVSRIPPLLSEQEARSKDNINLNYQRGSLPSRAALLSAHGARWAAVRAAWLQQAARVEHRYHATQQLLNKINVINNGM